MNRNKVQIEIDVDTLKGIRHVRALQQELNGATKEADELRKAADKASRKLENYSGGKLKANDPKFLQLMKESSEAQEAYRKSRVEVEKYNQQIDRNIKALGLSGLTNKELNSYLREQARLYNTTLRGSIEYQQAIENLQKAEAELAQRRADKKGAVSFFDNAKGILMPALIGGIAGAGIDVLGQMIGNIFGSISQKIDQVIAKSDKISNIKNAIKGTTDEAKNLNAEITKLDNRLDIATRRQILVESGKLDVPTNELVSYNQAMTEAVITMQEDFPEGVEALVTNLTKVKSLYKDTKELKYADSVRQIGSAFKGLADEGTATAKFQSEFLLRLGALDEKTRPTITQLMGLGAALEESGLTDEIAASGVQSVLKTAFENADLFAKFFGKSKKEFQEFINLNPNQFLLEFSKRLQPLTASQQMETLQNLKIGSQEASKVLGVLGNKFDIVVEKQAKANKYFQEGTRLTELYSEVNDNLTGKYERLSNRIGAWFSNSKMSLFLEGAINGIVDYGLAIFDTTTHIEKLQKSLDTQNSAVAKLEKNYLPLINRYEVLTSNSKVAAQHQGEINEIVQTLATVLPKSALQFDKYGNAIGISTQKAKEFVDIQKAVLKAQNAAMINTLNNEMNNRQKRIDELDRQTQVKPAKDRAGRDSWEMTQYSNRDILSLKGRFLTQAELDAKKKELSEIRKLNDEAKLAIKGLSGENIELPKAVGPIPGNEGSTNGKPFEKSDKSAEKLAEARKSNHAKLLDDLAQMDIQSIEKDSDRKEAQIRYNFKKEDEANKQLVKANELSQEDYLNWRSKAYQFMLDEVARNDKDTNEKIAKEVTDTNQKALLRRLELHKDKLQAELENAKANNDLKAIYEAEVNLSITEQEIELAKATADEKITIEEAFLTKRLAIHDKFIKEREAKDQKDRATDFDKKQELIEKEKTARAKLYEKIGTWIHAINDITSAFFDFQAQAIANQQVREDNLYNKKIENLEAQKKKGIISEAEYNKKKLLFDTEYDKKTREIKNKAAQADKVARIAQAIMSVAQAVIAGLSSPFPFNTILPAVAGTVGALQVAKIATTEIPQYFDGDFTHQNQGVGVDGRGGKIAIVHPNEFFLNARATANPSFPAILPILRSLNSGKRITQATTAPSSNSVAPPANNQVQDTLQQLNTVIQQLTEVLPHIKATVEWGYRENQEFDRNRKKYEQSNQDSYLK